MRLLQGLAIILVSLAVQAGLGRLWPEAQRYVDMLLVPVVLYGVGRPQSSAMWAGCASGLLKDAWFEVGSFGLGGFKHTLIGWLAAAVGARFDMNHGAGRMLAGVLICLANNLLDPAILPLLDRPIRFPAPMDLTIQAIATGLLAVVSGSILDRMGWNRSSGYKPV